MKYKKQCMIIFILGLLVFTLVLGCNKANLSDANLSNLNKSDPNKLNGIWEDRSNGSKIEFINDRFIITGGGRESPFYRDIEGTYLLLPNNQIRFTYSGGSTDDYSFRRNENVIQINYGTFTKKK